jgi:cyclic pyranopterin phosphate synthase
MDRKPAPRTERRRLTHLDRAGRPRMVDVSAKPSTARRAVAEGFVACSQETLSLVIDGGIAKGDDLLVAELAGVMAGKRTSELIPLCHPLPLSHVGIDIRPTDTGYEIEATARTTSQTGVEMEALTAVAVAALTIYDMVKAADRGMIIGEIRLVSKRGGRSGEYRHP